MPHAPRATARGRRTATSASASAVVATAVFRRQHATERLDDVGRALRLGEPEVADRRAGERQRAPDEPGHGGGGQDADARMEPAAPRAAGRLDGERQKREEPEQREQRSHREEQPGARVAPRHGEPAEGEDAVHHRRRLRDVAEREHRRGERDREPEPW